MLGEFVRGVRPVGYLARPLLAVAVLAVVLGLASALFRQWAVVIAVFAMAWIVQPESTIALVVAGVTAGLVAYRLWKHRTPNMDGALLAAAGVFLVAGLVPVVPMMSWSTPARADVPTDGPPQYVILLDGYPRADSLAEIGYPIDGFVSELEARGFTHYPEATTDHPKTFQTLTALTGGDPADWREADVANNRRLRDEWRLPAGWVAVSPPMGFVTLPHTRSIDPGGITFFESKLLGRSVLRDLAGGWVWDAYRERLDDSLDALASTKEQRVFAHIFAPHLPILYDETGPTEPLDCWPYCAAIDPRPPGVEPGELARRVGGYVYWLNDRLLGVVDAILANRPQAEIVLFSDHGGRWDAEETDEWRRVFLASLGEVGFVDSHVSE